MQSESKRTNLEKVGEVPGWNRHSAGGKGTRSAGHQLRGAARGEQVVPADDESRSSYFYRSFFGAFPISSYPKQKRRSAGPLLRKTERVEKPVAMKMVTRLFVDFEGHV
jgi:hypothetical protein